MSGGRFDYIQYRITEITDAIEHEIEYNNDESDEVEWDFIPHNFKDETIAEFKKGIEILKTAQIYAQRIDWLLSGDDGEENFHRRLAKDLSKMEK